jgi:hypothetical protein
MRGKARKVTLEVTMRYKITAVVLPTHINKALEALAGAGIRSVVVRSESENVITVTERTEKPEPEFHPEGVIYGPHSPDANSRGPDLSPRKFVGGKKDKGILGIDLVEQIINGADRVFTWREVQNEFEKRKFARGSASNAMHVLMEKGKIKRVARGRYCRAGLTIHK